MNTRVSDTQRRLEVDEQSGEPIIVGPTPGCGHAGQPRGWGGAEA